MAQCSVVSNFALVRKRREVGSSVYWGETRHVHFFSSESMPRLPGELMVYSETYDSRLSDRDPLFDDEIRKQIKAQTEVKSGVWLGTFEYERKQYYHVAVMLPKAEFELFDRMVERDFGEDIEFSFSFAYWEFEDRPVGQPSKDEFLSGKKLVIRNPEIETIFAPGALVRRREASR